MSAQGITLNKFGLGVMPPVTTEEVVMTSPVTHTVWSGNVVEELVAYSPQRRRGEITFLGSQFPENLYFSCFAFISWAPSSCKCLFCVYL